MNISMNPAHRYVTQSAAWDKLLVRGPLTDRRIAAYQKAGYYGTPTIKEASTRRVSTKHRKLSAAQLTKRYGI